MDPKVAAWTLLGMMYPYFYPFHSEDLSLSDEVIEQLENIFLDIAAVGLAWHLDFRECD